MLRTVCRHRRHRPIGQPVRRLVQPRHRCWDSSQSGSARRAYQPAQLGRGSRFHSRGRRRRSRWSTWRPRRKGPGDVVSSTYRPALEHPSWRWPGPLRRRRSGKGIGYPDIVQSGEPFDEPAPRIVLDNKRLAELTGWTPPVQPVTRAGDGVERMQGGECRRGDDRMTPARRKVAIFTGNRAEYGLQFPILKAIAEDPRTGVLPAGFRRSPQGRTLAGRCRR